MSTRTLKVSSGTTQQAKFIAVILKPAKFYVHDVLRINITLCWEVTGGKTTRLKLVVQLRIVWISRALTSKKGITIWKRHIFLKCYQ